MPRVQTWKGKVVRVELDSDTTALAVKKQLQVLEDVPYQQQHLFLDGRELLDTDHVRAEDELVVRIQASHSSLLDMAVPLPGEVTLGEFNASLVQLGPDREAYQDRLDQWQYHDLQIYPAELIPKGVPPIKPKDVELKSGAPSLTERVKDLATHITGRIKLPQLFGQTQPDPLAKPDDPTTCSGFAWHPFLPKWAVAYNDAIWLHDLRNGKWEEAALVHRAQAHIRQIQWNPLSGTMLAVACEGGVCIWHLTGRKSVTVLPHESIRSISWSCCGRFLACTSAGSSQLMVWDVAKGPRCEQAVTSLGPPGTPLLQCLWAPRARNLLATSSSSFRIWSRWKADSEVGEHWTSNVYQTSSPVVSAVWSSSGEFLLVAQEGCSLISVVQCPATCLLGSDTLDVSAVETPGGLRVGGAVQLMAWSPTSARLAVSFASADAGGELIALFDTSFQHKVLVFRPIGFIRGPPHPAADTCNKAAHLAFAPNFDRGALLSVAWSGGQISTHPFYFAEPKRLKRARVHNDDDEPKRIPRF